MKQINTTVYRLPGAGFAEKDGTFVNCHGRVQRVGRAFKPLPDAREDWRVLLDIAHGLDQPLSCRTPQEVFTRLAVTGRTASPPLFEVLAVLGRDETLARLRDAHAAAERTA